MSLCADHSSIKLIFVEKIFTKKFSMLNINTAFLFPVCYLLFAFTYGRQLCSLVGVVDSQRSLQTSGRKAS